jgi:hypothetical protein
MDIRNNSLGLGRVNLGANLGGPLPGRVNMSSPSGLSGLSGRETAGPGLGLSSRSSLSGRALASRSGGSVRAGLVYERLKSLGAVAKKSQMAAYTKLKNIEKENLSGNLKKY